MKADAAPQQRTGRARRRFVGGLLLAGALQAAGAQPAEAPRLPAVVVWDFDDQSAAPAARGAYLQRSLSENLTAALLQVPGLPVVERQRLRALLAEQNLGSAALADDDARLRLGRVVGAQRMVFGGFFVIGDAVQVHVRVIDAATSRVLFSDEATGALDAVMAQVEPMNRRLVQALGGAPAAATAWPPQAWQAYDQALALADAGQLDAAAQALQALLARHKDFQPAERQLVALLERMARR